MDLEFPAGVEEPLRKITKAIDRLKTSNTKLTARRVYIRRAGPSRPVGTLKSSTAVVVVLAMTSAFI